MNWSSYLNTLKPDSCGEFELNDQLIIATWFQEHFSLVEKGIHCRMLIVVVFTFKGLFIDVRNKVGRLITSLRRFGIQKIHHEKYLILQSLFSLKLLHRPAKSGAEWGHTQIEESVMWFFLVDNEFRQRLECVRVVEVLAVQEWKILASHVVVLHDY
jgi:hypothetical protein